MKPGIEKNIVKAAKKEFFQKGFKACSMNNIAKDLNISSSNIYYYFENKDALFLEVVKPLKEELDKMFGIWQHINPAYVSVEAYTDEQYQKRSIETLIKLSLKYKKEFNLLLFNAQGSALEQLCNSYIDGATRSGMEYLRVLSEKHPELNLNISEPFIRAMSAHTFVVIGEIVSQDLNKDEIASFMEDLVVFNTQGWKGIIYKGNQTT